MLLTVAAADPDAGAYGEGVYDAADANGGTLDGLAVWRVLQDHGASCAEWHAQADAIGADYGDPAALLRFLGY